MSTRSFVLPSLQLRFSQSVENSRPEIRSFFPPNGTERRCIALLGQASLPDLLINIAQKEISFRLSAPISRVFTLLQSAFHQLDGLLRPGAAQFIGFFQYGVLCFPVARILARLSLRVLKKQQQQ